MAHVLKRAEGKLEERYVEHVLKRVEGELEETYMKRAEGILEERYVERSDAWPLSRLWSSKQKLVRTPMPWASFAPSPVVSYNNECVSLQYSFRNGLVQLGVHALHTRAAAAARHCSPKPTKPATLICPLWRHAALCGDTQHLQVTQLSPECVP